MVYQIHAKDIDIDGNEAALYCTLFYYLFTSLFLCTCVFVFVFCHYVFYVFLSLCASTASVTHRQTRQQVVCDVIWGTYKSAVFLLDLPEDDTGDESLAHWTSHGFGL